MKLGFLVNRLETEKAGYTTTGLALAAAKRGHEVCHIAIDALACDEAGHISAWTIHSGAASSVKGLVAKLADRTQLAKIDIGDLDIVFLRNDPAEDFSSRPWARLAGINFGRLAQQSGTLVLNDPDGLAHAVNKMYLHLQPPSVRPRSIITRSRDDIIAFAEVCGGRLVVKPLHGSGGHNVFLLGLDYPANVNQIIEAIREEGYVLAQEYLTAAEDGDVRLFLIDGEVLAVNGTPAAIRRRRQGGDLRNNISAGAKVEAAVLTDEMVAIVDAVRPRLASDGMFLVGLDVVGDKLMEINVFSPGGLAGASRLHGVDFFAPIIAALEQKVSAGDGLTRRQADFEPISA